MNTLKVDPEQIEKVRKQYENTPLWMKAPNGMPTKLTEQQWLMVRTPAFKLQYGNWIKSYYTKGWKNITDNTAIKKRPPVVFNILNPAEDKKDIVKIFTEFGIVTNENDGRSVKFPANTAGRMVYKKNYVSFFDILFKSSIRAWSENETLFKGHKEHLNAKEYHHYVNKFSTQDGEFYIRFTVREAKETRWVNEGELLNNVHSAEISDIGIYKNKSVSLAGIQTGSTNALANVKKTFVDYKLAYYLEGVNINDVSIPLDPSTSEPVLSP